LGAGLTIQPRKKFIVTKLQKGRPGPNWAVEPYDDDDDDDDDIWVTAVIFLLKHNKIAFNCIPLSASLVNWLQI
jgi:hypothetical protein